jgi:hypothetical protein
MKYSKKETEEARTMLLKFLAPGDTVYTVLRHVSRSGMMRRIDLYKVTDEGPFYLSGYAAVLLGEPRPDNGVKVNGCGMDMGFHLVYALSYRLWPEGFGCIGEKCPSNDHSNYDRSYTRNVQVYNSTVIERDHMDPGAANSHWHKDGGYALNHRWL